MALELPSRRRKTLQNTDAEREGKARTWHAGQSLSSSARAREQLVGGRGQREGLGEESDGVGKGLGVWGLTEHLPREAQV